MCPDPDLSEALWPHIRRALFAARQRGTKALKQAIQGAKSYHIVAGGRAWIPSWLAPP
jgi:hypothetical protein